MNNPYTAKKRLNSDGSYYIFRFWPVATLLVFITYFLVAGLQERADVPRYHRDCAAAWSSSNSPFPTQPCFYKPATVDLTTRHDHGPRGSGDSQSAEITYPDGSTSLMSVQKIDGRENSAHDIPALEVNGPCWVEIWHGKVTTVLNTNHRLLSEENPEDKAGITLWPWLLVMLVMTIIVGIRIRLSGRKM